MSSDCRISEVYRKQRSVSLLRLTNRYTVGVLSQLLKIRLVLPIRRRPVSTRHPNLSIPVDYPSFAAKGIKGKAAILPVAPVIHFFFDGLYLLFQSLRIFRPVAHDP